MGSSSIKINSISIDLAGAADEIEKCDHFSIRGFVAETREKDVKKCWPFPEESVSLVEQESYSLPSLSVPKFKWWRCMSCIKDLDHHANGTKDCGLHINSSEKKLDGNSSMIPSTSKLHSLDHEPKQKETDIAGNNNATCVKKVHPQSMDASTVRSKSRKHTSPEKVGNKKISKEKANKSSKKKQNVDHQAAVTTLGSSEIAGVVDDTPPKTNKNHKSSRALMESDNVSSESIERSGLQRRKTRKVRLLSELLGKAKTKTSDGGSNNIVKDHESPSKRESIRGRKRKYASRILSTIGAATASSDESDSESTDSGFDRDPIKGKKKNRRFQVVDEFVPSLSCETTSHENNADPSKNNALLKEKDPLSTQKTEKKLSFARKKKKNKPVVDNGKSTLISFSAEGNQIKPRNGLSINEIPQSTRDLFNEKRVVGGLFEEDQRLASEGYFRKYNDKPLMSLQFHDIDHLMSRDASGSHGFRDFGSSSKSNTSGWLRNGVDVVDFSNTNRSSFQNFNLRHNSSSSEVSNLSCALQKDVSAGADRKGKTIMVQEHLGPPGSVSQSHERKENTFEDQNDDIPMEIVELMAKNQYERCLPDKEEDKQPSQETAAPKSKNALLIDLNETYDNGISMEDNNISRPLPKPCDNSSNGRREEEHFPFGKPQKSLDFFPITQPSYVPSSSSQFGIFPQENRATSSIRFSDHNRQWLGNVPTMTNQNPSPSSFRLLRGCNTCQSVPNQYRGPEPSHPIWSSSMIPPQGHHHHHPHHHHHKPVSFNMDQSTTKLGMLSQVSSNENSWNLNFVAPPNGKQKCGSDSDFSFGCKHAPVVNTSSRSVDAAFSNESSIPAMHLLSLMDPRLRSSTPVDHHGNTKFTKRHFPPVNQTKERVEIQTGDSSKTTAAYPGKQLPFDFYTSRKNFSMIPPVGTSSFSFQNPQASWNHHHHQEKKTKRQDSYKPVFADQGKFQLLGASNSMMLPLKFHMKDKEKKQKRKADNNASSSAALPSKNGSGSGPIVCSVNRNPADFTIAEPGNVYMLSGENLKVRKRASLCKQDALKQTKKPVGPFTENA